MDDPTYEYRNPAHAGATWAVLREQRPGGNRGIDYVALSMASCSNSHDTHQDIALEKMDEYNELTSVFQKAFNTTRPWLDRVASHLENGRYEFLGRQVAWEFWIAHHAFQESYGTIAKHSGLGYEAVRYRIRTHNMPVREQLVERGLLLGYGGRDLAYVTEEPRDRVETWHGEEE